MKRKMLNPMFWRDDLVDGCTLELSRHGKSETYTAKQIGGKFPRMVLTDSWGQDRYAAAAINHLMRLPDGKRIDAVYAPAHPGEEPEALWVRPRETRFSTGCILAGNLLELTDTENGRTVSALVMPARMDSEGKSVELVGAYRSRAGLNNSFCIGDLDPWLRLLDDGRRWRLDKVYGCAPAAEVLKLSPGTRPVIWARKEADK